MRGAGSGESYDLNDYTLYVVYTVAVYLKSNVISI